MKRADYFKKSNLEIYFEHYLFAFFIGLIFLLLISSATYGVQKQSLKATEYQIKAVYLYNFLLFVEWPQADNESVKSAVKKRKTVNKDDKGKEKTIIIGIVGRDPFGKGFADVEGKVIKSKGKRLIIKRFGPYRKGLNLDKCELIFVSSSEKGNFRNILQTLKGSAALTVADTSNFLQAGGMINLVKVKKKIRWEINQTPIKREGLRLSSQLLRNATKIVKIPNNHSKNVMKGHKKQTNFVHKRDEGLKFAKKWSK